MKKQTPSRKSFLKQTPNLLPTPEEVKEALTGVDLWEMHKPWEVIARGRKDCRSWLRPQDPSQDHKLGK